MIDLKVKDGLSHDDLVMVEPCETRPTGQAAQIWNHASLVLILIICAFSVVRGAHAFVVLRALSGSDRGETPLF
jgi:hypothetical protein